MLWHFSKKRLKHYLLYTRGSLTARTMRFHDLERGIRQCGEYAFGIEMQVTKNSNKFLFESALIELGSEQISEKRYDDKAFGSWLIEMNDKRIVADGKHNLLTKQSKAEAKWLDDFSFLLKDLNYQY